MVAVSLPSQKWVQVLSTIDENHGELKEKINSQILVLCSFLCSSIIDLLFFRLPVFFLVRPVTSNLRRSSVQSPKRCTTKSLGSWNFSTRSTGVEGKRIFPPGENGGVRKTKGLIFLIEDLLGTNGIDVNIWLARSNVSYFLN